MRVPAWQPLSLNQCTRNTVACIDPARLYPPLPSEHAPQGLKIECFHAHGVRNRPVTGSGRRYHFIMESTPVLAVALAALIPGLAFAQPLQKNDEAYTAKIRQYTTESFFSTPLVDHLPASDRVPTPEKVLGSIVGAPDKLTYTKDIYRYFRELERTSKRVKVSTIGVSEEGREMLLVAVSDEANIANLDQYKRMTARLADPRVITSEEAAALLDQDLPFYWLSGSIHSPETGSPEMLMELAYR